MIASALSRSDRRPGAASPGLGSSVPHELQNRKPSWFSSPQRGQYTPANYPIEFRTQG